MHPTKNNPFQLSVAAATDTGLVRDHNEDRYAVINLSQPAEDFMDGGEGISHLLMAVADGMGGMEAGEIAADLAMDSVRETAKVLAYATARSIEDKMLSLELCFRDAQLRTDLYALENPETWSMGTTLVVGWVCQDQLLVAWLGDSRCYVYIPENGLRQVTSDHSLVQEMVDAGEITVQQASLHPMKNIITRALYAGSDKEPKPDYATIDLQPGMRILLCSDGLSNMVSDHDMGDMLRDLPNVQACATRLVEAANHEGGIDNITVVVAEVSA